MSAAVVMAAAGMAFAMAVSAAGVAFTVVMMVAMNVGIKGQISVEQCLYRIIGGAGNAAEELDTGLFQCILGAAADAAANQCVHIVVSQKSCQCAVPLSHGIHHKFLDDGVVFDVVYLELRGVAEMLEDHAVFIGDCNSHNSFSFVFRKNNRGIFPLCRAGFLTAMLGGALAQAIVAATDV